MPERGEVGALWPYHTKAAHDERKRMAAQVVANALMLGELHKQPCEACGSDEAEAHHADYSKPLQVTWLCRRDHLARHGRTQREMPNRPTRRRGNELAKADILAITRMIRDEMDRQGLSQRELATLTGVSQPMVHRWFAAGLKTVGAIRLACDALNLTFTYSLEPNAQPSSWRRRPAQFGGQITDSVSVQE